MAKTEYEFTFMSKKESWKLAALKLACLAFMADGLYFLIFVEPSRLSYSLSHAAGVCAAAALYANCFSVKSRVSEMVEPPYRFQGGGMIVVGAAFSVAAFYVLLTGN
ncbi:MAG: hypothetical protein ACFHX7_07845 [Pseudomonadota bacterium]